MTILGLRCTWAFSSCGEWVLLFIVACGLLTAVASLVEHGLQGMCGLSSWGGMAYLPRGMWNLPRPGINPMSSVLTVGFLTSGPPGKSDFTLY